MAIDERSRIWEGVYSSFSQVWSERDAFAGEIWSDKQLARARALLDAAAAGISTPALVTSEYALPIVAALAGSPGRPLRILDFGGGLGVSYVPLTRMLPAASQLQFVVVENASICRHGAELFAADPTITFVTDVPRDQAFDIAHAGSSFHYVDDWRGMLRSFCDTGAQYLLFADLPAGDIETFVTAQLFHGDRIPVRFWNIGEFIHAVESLEFELVMKAPFAGRYLAPGALLPTAHFPKGHQLASCCQLVFRRRTPTPKG